MKMIDGNNFIDYESHDTYFLKEDALRCVSYDYYFSPTRKYYCGAGCKICYIQEQLGEGQQYYKDSIPEAITDADTAFWLSTFPNFYSIRTDDDFRYLKLNHPHIFEWYAKHGHLFEFGMTDNSFLAHHKIFMNEITIRGIADITMSESFVRTVKKDKLYAIFKDYISKYKIGHVKIIRTSGNFHHPEEILDLVEFLKEYNIVFSLHQDFRIDDINIYDLDSFDNQNTYVFSDDKRRYQIHRSSVHLFNDRFYFSYDDASNVDTKPFYIIDKTIPFDPKDFLYHMLVGKLKYYEECIADMGEPQNATAEKFKNYFENTKNFKVNKDYNFIPEFMLPDTSMYYSKLVEYGFKKTSVGLYLPGKKARPLIDYK
jgi:hypothetical protein